MVGINVAEESAQSQAAVFAVVPFMPLIILTVLMFHLQSFQRLFIVLVCRPPTPPANRPELDLFRADESRANATSSTTTAEGAVHPSGR